MDSEAATCIDTRRVSECQASLAARRPAGQEAAIYGNRTRHCFGMQLNTDTHDQDFMLYQHSRRRHQQSYMQEQASQEVPVALLQYRGDSKPNKMKQDCTFRNLFDTKQQYNWSHVLSHTAQSPGGSMPAACSAGGSVTDPWATGHAAASPND